MRGDGSDPEDLDDVFLDSQLVPDGEVFRPDVAELAGGDALAVWRDHGEHVLQQRFTPLGAATGPLRALDEAAGFFPNDPAVEATPAQALAGWTGTFFLDPPPPGIVQLRQLSAGGVPLSPIVDLDAEHPRDLAFALLTDGDAVAAWIEGDEPPSGVLAPSEACFQGIAGRRLALDSTNGVGGLVLRDRFQVSASWSDPHNGGSGEGLAVPLYPQSGFFWFFDPGNPEITVKVLDGRAINGRFWLFYASLTDVELDLRVEDAVTGIERTYHNPPFHLASGADTASFLAPGPSDGFGRPFEPPQAVDSAAGPCSGIGLPVLRRPGLCVGDFEIEVAWHDPFNGGSGVGDGLPIAGRGGYLWFFRKDNPELVVKVLDGRPVNGYFWVFYGAMTNVEFDLKVSRVGTDQVATYHNEPFEFRSLADTQAFSDCTEGPPPLICF